MTIGRLARAHGLSRATLLYYDRIGLLGPSRRRANGYREYTPRDEERLRKVCLYRRTGLPLAEIRRLLAAPRKELALALERQLDELAQRIVALRDRQRLIVELLRKRRLLERVTIMNRETWTRLLRASGLSDADLHRWHREFERLDPEHHQRFLEFLCIPASDIRAIRSWSRRNGRRTAAASQGRPR
jgi:DNA-binding transcriptional MerR regulator